MQITFLFPLMHAGRCLMHWAWFLHLSSWLWGSFARLSMSSRAIQAFRWPCSCFSVRAAVSGPAWHLRILNQSFQVSKHYMMVSSPAGALGLLLLAVVSIFTVLGFKSSVSSRTRAREEAALVRWPDPSQPRNSYCFLKQLLVYVSRAAVSKPKTAFPVSHPRRTPTLWPFSAPCWRWLRSLSFSSWTGLRSGYRVEGTSPSSCGPARPAGRRAQSASAA